MRNIFILLSMIALYTSCDDSLDNPQWYIYAETQCADPWGTGTSSSLEEVRIAVENYLENQEICVEEIEIIDSEPIITCQACDCSSGRGIRVQGEADDEAIFINIGFNIE